MNKAGTRFAAFALALAMVFTTALPAFAEGGPGEGGENTGDPGTTENGGTAPDTQQDPDIGEGGEGSGSSGIQPISEPVPIDIDPQFAITVAADPDNAAPEAWVPGETELHFLATVTNNGGPALAKEAGSRLQLIFVNEKNETLPDNSEFAFDTSVTPTVTPTDAASALDVTDVKPEHLRVKASSPDKGAVIFPAGVSVTFGIIVKPTAQDRDAKDFTFRIRTVGTQLSNYDGTLAQTFPFSCSTIPPASSPDQDTYTVTYYGNEKTVSNASRFEKDTVGEIVLLSESEAGSAGLVPAGQKLTKWAVGDPSGSPQYDPGAHVGTDVLFAGLSDKSIELYAVLEAVPTTIIELTYEPNGGVGSAHTVSQTVEVGSEATFTLLDAAEFDFAAPDGKVFAGWHTNREASEGGAGLMPAGTEFTIGTSTTLYAIWKNAPAGDYSITYHYVDPATAGKAPDAAVTDYSTDGSFTLRSAGDMGTPELGSKLNGRQIVGWHTMEANAGQNMTVDQNGKLELETYDSKGNAKHSSGFTKLTAFDAKNGNYGVCGESIELNGTKNIDLYPVLGPAFGYTLTVKDGDFPKDAVEGTAGYAKDNRYTFKGVGTEVMANGMTSAANAPKYVLYQSTPFKKGDIVTVTTAVPVDDRKTADQYHFVAWFDKRAHQNKNEANTIVLPGEEAIFGDTANVYSLDAVWFDMEAEDAHFTYDGKTPHSVGLSKATLTGTSEFDAEGAGDVEIRDKNYRYHVRYWVPDADPDDDPDRIYDEVTGGLDALPKFVDAGTYRYEIEVDVGIKVDGTGTEYYGQTVQESDGWRYVLETYTVNATLVIDPVDLYISHASTRYLVGSDPITVNFNSSNTEDSGDHAPVEVTGLQTGDTLAYSTSIKKKTVIDLYKDHDTASIEILHEDTDRPLYANARYNYRIHEDISLRILAADVVSIRVPFTKTLRIADPVPYGGAVLPAGSYVFTFAGREEEIPADSGPVVDAATAALTVPAGEGKTSVVSDKRYATFNFVKAGTYCYTLREEDDPTALPAHVTNNTEDGYTLEFVVDGNIDSRDLTVTVKQDTYRESIALDNLGTHEQKTGTYSRTLAFENIYTPPTGTLTLSKKVEPTDTTTEFTFTITAPVVGLGPITATRTGSGPVTSPVTVAFNAGGVADVTLRGGETLTLTGMPVGRYAIRETPKTGYNVSTSVQVGTAAAVTGTDPRVTAEVTEGTTAVAYTNTVSTGSLTVHKTVEPAGTVTDTDFTFTVTIGTNLTGDYGDMHFDEGVATVTLKNGESKTADGLPAGIDYAVTETDTEDFFQMDPVLVEGIVFADEDTALEFVNRTAGDLTVQKKLTPPADVIDEDTVFTFAVTPVGRTLTGRSFATDTDGTPGSVTFDSDNKATVTVTGEGAVTVKDLPTGDYTVKEVDDKDHTLENFDVSGSPADATVFFGRETTITVTNARRPGTLTVHKDVISPLAGDLTKEFTFTVTAPGVLDGKYGEISFGGGTSGDVSFHSSNTATFTLKNGEEAVLDLPAGGIYRVTETAADWFTTEISGDGKPAAGDPAAVDVLVSKDAPSRVVYTNTRQTGSLRISKTVTGQPDVDAVFHFTLTGRTADGQPLVGSFDYGPISRGSITFTDGSGTVDVHAGETLTIQDLPAGAVLTIEETGLTIRGSDDLELARDYDTTVRVGSGAATAGRSAENVVIPTPNADGTQNAVTAAFTNTYRSASLTVSKTVTTDPDSQRDAPQGDAFAFTVILKRGGKDLTGTYFYTGSKSGTIHSGGQLYLSDGQSVTIQGLPLGTEYTVTETPVFLYTAAEEEKTGTLFDKGETRKLSFTNVYNYQNWPVEPVTLTLQKEVRTEERALLTGDEGSFVIGMLYTWDDDAYGVPDSYVRVDVPVQLTLNPTAGRKLSGNGGAGYAFAFNVTSQSGDDVLTGTGNWVLSIPADDLEGKDSYTSKDAMLSVWVDKNAAASPAFTVSEKPAGGNSTFDTSGNNTYKVTVTDPENNGFTVAPAGTPADTLAFTNTYVGDTTAPGSGTAAALSRAAGSTAPSFGYFRTIELNADSGYSQNVTLPVGINGTTVHLFEIPVAGYTLDGASFTGSGFMPSAEGGVLTIPATASSGGLGTVTFTNIKDPVTLRFDVTTGMTAADPLPQGEYGFTYTVTRTDGTNLPADLTAAARSGEDPFTLKTVLAGGEASAQSSSAVRTIGFYEPGTYIYRITETAKPTVPGLHFTGEPVSHTCTLSVTVDKNAAAGRLQVTAVTVGSEPAEPDNGVYHLPFAHTLAADAPTPPTTQTDPPQGSRPGETQPTAAKAPVPTPAPAAPVAVSVPRTADDMPLGAVWALFGAAAAALIVLGVVWYRRRKSK